MNMPVDLPANFQETAHGAPVVQIAQASVPKCTQGAEATYKVGTTGQTLTVGKNTQGQATFTLKNADGTATPLKTGAPPISSPTLTIAVFTDKSVLTVFNMSKPNGSAMPSTYKTADGKTHTLTQDTAPATKCGVALKIS